MIEKLKNIFKPLVVFYILVFYIFASFSWWTYLHMMKNKQVFELEVTQLQLQNNRSSADLESSAMYQAYQSKYKKKNRMILGEGLVFSLIIMLGIYRIHYGFQREISLNRQQRNFLLSISHELKSPLASIQLALQTMRRRQLPPDKQELLTANSLQDVDRLKLLVDDILMAAKLDNQSIHFVNTEMNLSDMTHAIVKHLRVGLGKDRQWELDIEEDIAFKGDQMALNSIFSNLIENAIKYSDRGDEIGVSLKNVGRMIIFQVMDTGVGISEKDKIKIFEKFYRAGNEDTRTTKGTGLGLFIVSQLVKVYQGKVSVMDNQPKGTVFQLSLPIA